MPGRLDRNLRRAKLAEDLGILLLQQLCAVARVPRDDDFGIDAVATLLRSEGRFHIAEESFNVQIKARSVRTITYDSDQYRWMLRLSLPLFIASVSIPEGQCALHATHNVTCRGDTEHYRKVVMHLDHREWCGDSGILHQYLGEPILVWTLADCESEEFRRLAYDLLSKWVSLERADLSLRTINATTNIYWRTNEVPHAGGLSICGNPDDFESDVRAAAPFLLKLGTHVLARQLRSDEPCKLEAITFVLLAVWLARNGSDDLRFMDVLTQRSVAGPEGILTES